MIFYDIAKARYSCRNYKPDEVPVEKIKQVVDAFGIAPSAVNYQPWCIIIIREQKNKEKIYQAYQRDWIKSAPVLLVVCGDHKVSWKRKDGKDHLDIDIGIAIDHLTLQATELGLATCWVCNFDRKILEDNLNLPEHIEPVAIIPLGHPNDQPDVDRHSLKRKSMDEIVRWENY
jgi:nitroreductase